MSVNTPVRIVTVDGGIQLKLNPKTFRKFPDEIICWAYGKLKCEKEHCLSSILDADFYLKRVKEIEAEKQMLVERSREIGQNLPKIKQHNLDTEDLIRNLVENQENAEESRKQMENEYNNEINKLNATLDKLEDEMALIKGENASYLEEVEKLTDKINQLLTENDDLKGRKMRETNFKRSASENSEGGSNLAKIQRTMNPYKEEQIKIKLSPPPPVVQEEQMPEPEFRGTRALKHSPSQESFETKLPGNYKRNGCGPAAAVDSKSAPKIIHPKQSAAATPQKPIQKAAITVKSGAEKTADSPMSHQFFRNFHSYLVSVAPNIRGSLFTIDAAVRFFLEIDPSVIQLPKDGKDKIRDELLKFGQTYFQEDRNL